MKRFCFLSPSGGTHSCTLILNVSDIVIFRTRRSVALKDQVSTSTAKAVASMLLPTGTTSYSAFCAVAGTGSMKVAHGLSLAGGETGPASRRSKSKDEREKGSECHLEASFVSTSEEIR